MKKTLSMLAIMSAVLVSCTKSEINEDNGNPPDEPVYEISIYPKDLTFGAKGGDQTVTVTSSEDWYLDGESDWCKVSTLYGSNGDKVTFSADPYENTAEERTATFTFYCGDRDVELIVTQEAKVYSISVEPKELTFEVEGGEKEITITSSDNWSLSNVPEWISLSEEEGENGAVVIVTVEYNNETDTRSGDILFICGDKDAKVSVTQQADDSPIIQFKDPYFLDALLETYSVLWDNEWYEVDVDKNNDGQISESEAASVEVLDLYKAQDQSGNDIRNIDELKYFTGLRYLSFERCNIENVTLSNSKLEELDLSYDAWRGGEIKTLNIDKCIALKKLDCKSNHIVQLDLSNNPALESLNCYGNDLTSLNISGCSALTSLECFENQLTSLDVSSNTALESLNCFGNDLTSLNISGCSALTSLECFDNQLTSLDVSNNTALTSLDCGYNQLATLDVSNNTALTSLECFDNQLTSLDVSNNTALTSLDCGYNQLITLDVSNNTALTELYCADNELTTLDVSNNTELKYLSCYSNDITSLDLSKCTKLNSLFCVDFMGTSVDNLSIKYDTKCPLESLKIYKYHTIEDISMEATKRAYGSVIEYVE